MVTEQLRRKCPLHRGTPVFQIRVEERDHLQAPDMGLHATADAQKSGGTSGALDNGGDSSCKRTHLSTRIYIKPNTLCTGVLASELIAVPLSSPSSHLPLLHLKALRLLLGTRTCRVVAGGLVGSGDLPEGHMGPRGHCHSPRTL